MLAVDVVEAKVHWFMMRAGTAQNRQNHSALFHCMRRNRQQFPNRQNGTAISAEFWFHDRQTRRNRRFVKSEEHVWKYGNVIIQ